MMRYEIEMSDGTIAEMQVAPKAVRFDDGRAFDLMYCTIRGAKVILKGENEDSSITIEAEGDEVRPDSVRGAVIEFHDPMKCIGKWHPSVQSRVVAVRQRS